MALIAATLENPSLTDVSSPLLIHTSPSDYHLQPSSPLTPSLLANDHKSLFQEIVLPLLENQLSILILDLEGNASYKLFRLFG